MNLRIYILLILSLFFTNCGDTPSAKTSNVTKQPKDTTKMIHAVNDDETDWTWFVGTDVEYNSPSLLLDTYFTHGLPPKIGHLQYFLDTDNNPNTGFSTGEDSWKISGADFLIEDGDVYKSLSTTKWSWKYIGKFDEYKKSVEDNITQLHISTNNPTISSMIKSNTINITIEPFDTDWSSSYSTISTQSVKLQIKEQPIDYAKTIKDRVVNSFCSQSVLSKANSAISTYKTLKTKKYSQDEIYSSKNLYDIASVALPIACDFYLHNNAKDEASQIASYMINHYQYDNDKTIPYFKENGIISKVNLSHYVYSSKKTRVALSLILSKLNSPQKELLDKYLQNEFSYSKILSSTTSNRDFIYNTDFIYTISDGLLAYTALNDKQNLTKFKSYLEKFLEPTKGWLDGIKADGVSFHHAFHYNAYMYAYTPFISLISKLDKTPYQINKEKYLLLRNAIYNISLMGMNKDELPSLGGRHPFYINFPISKASILNLINIGGHILDKDIDEKVASMYYRLWKDELYKNSFDEKLAKGFWQFNYGALGIYRSSNYLVGLHGFNYSFKGGEVSPLSSGRNMYGRYQAYGTIEILYEGGKKDSAYPTNSSIKVDGWSNGDDKGFGWDWNRWPGTTSIVLPWEKLLPASTAYASELTEKKFSGALRFLDKKSGIFAMDFKQYDYQRPNHDSSFVFKKSVFAFDDMLVAMGSNISNNDDKHPTITTLFQNRLSKGHDYVVVDNLGEIGKEESIQTLHSKDHRWIIDAAGTGYYFINNTTNFTIRASMQTSPNRVDKTASMKNATKGEYITAWIEHGKAPKNVNYYYIVIPNATPQIMNSYKRTFSIPHLNGSNHVLTLPENRFAYALFNEQNNIDIGILREVNMPLMLFYKKDGSYINLSVVNPDLGYTYWDDVNNIKPKKVKFVLDGLWNLEKSSSQIKIEHQNTQTIISFISHDGLVLDLELIKQ